MAGSCVYIPEKGESLFLALREHFDYATTKEIFLKVTNKNFIEDFKGILSFDAEGFPTFESVINNPFVKAFIGNNNIQKVEQSRFKNIENTRANYSRLLIQAYEFNKRNPNRNNFVAVVEEKEDGKIGVTIKPKTNESVKEFEEQYKLDLLTKRLTSLLEPMGISVGILNEVETAAGRIGVTNFSRAKEVANGIANLIEVANNMEGQKALPEEIAHALIGIFRDDALVQRSLSLLEQNEEALRNILGNDYDDTVEFHDGDMSKVAEEALGHILEQNLLKKQDVIETPNQNLFQRLYTKIINAFRKFKPKQVYDILDEVDGCMSSFATDILKGTRQITREKIKAAERQVQFNALSDKIERNIKILKDAAKAETKRSKIEGSYNKQKRESSKQYAETILEYANEQADTTEGIFNYSKFALNMLKNIESGLNDINELDLKQKFWFLRSSMNQIQSFKPFIDAIYDAMIDDASDEDNMFSRVFVVNGEEVSIKDTIIELKHLCDLETKRVFKIATPAFIEFLKPVLGEEITVPFGRNKGKVISLEQLLKEAESDISFMDKWLQSMAKSSDILLQGFNGIVYKANDAARLNTIDFNEKIIAFRQKAKDLGITDFDWAFEVDENGKKTGNYISPVNNAKYQKDKKEFIAYLKKKYGVCTSEKQIAARYNEYKAWMQEHTDSKVSGRDIPDPTLYRNDDYYKLSDTQREILEDFKKIKNELEEKIPPHKRGSDRAIQMRKSGAERFWENATSPLKIYENTKQVIKNSFVEREDDDLMFGDTKDYKGLTDFSGREFMQLPIHFVTRLKEPEELSTDLIGSLMAYSYSVHQYEQLDNIVNGLEVGVMLVTDKENGRKVKKTSGSHTIKEKLKVGDTVESIDVNIQETNIGAKLADFMESKVYQRYIKNEGTIGNSNISTSKTVDTILSATTLARMGFNLLTNFANVTNGMAMQHIEAVAGEHFSYGDLVKADARYFKLVGASIAEINAVNKTNKLDLVDQLFNIKQDFDINSRRVKVHNWLVRIFGKDVALMGQGLGDHWLYNRTAIAMMNREQVLLNGQQMSLWDALQVEQDEKNPEIKRLNYKDIKNLDGTQFDVGNFGRRIADVNHNCFGTYNQEDLNMANRVAVGRAIQQFRKWMVPLYSHRFRGEHFNAVTGKYEEGYYRTFGRFLLQLKRGQFQIMAVYDQLDDYEKSNIRRVIGELALYAIVFALAKFIDWPDDKNRPWALKLAEYSVIRLSHEMGSLIPGLEMPQEMLKTLQSPVPAASSINDMFKLIRSTMTPSDYYETLQSGPYKGQTKLAKNIQKAPLPIISQINQINKFVGDIDNSIMYFARSY